MNGNHIWLLRPFCAQCICKNSFCITGQTWKWMKFRNKFVCSLSLSAHIQIELYSQMIFWGLSCYSQVYWQSQAEVHVVLNVQLYQRLCWATLDTSLSSRWFYVFICVLTSHFEETNVVVVGFQYTFLRTATTSGIFSNKWTSGHIWYRILYVSLAVQPATKCGNTVQH